MIVGCNHSPSIFVLVLVSIGFTPGVKSPTVSDVIVPVSLSSLVIVIATFSPVAKASCRKSTDAATLSSVTPHLKRPSFIVPDVTYVACSRYTPTL